MVIAIIRLPVFCQWKLIINLLMLAWLAWSVPSSHHTCMITDPDYLSVWVKVETWPVIINDTKHFQHQNPPVHIRGFYHVDGNQNVCIFSTEMVWMKSVWKTEVGLAYLKWTSVLAIEHVQYIIRRRLVVPWIIGSWLCIIPLLLSGYRGALKIVTTKKWFSAVLCMPIY